MLTSSAGGDAEHMLFDVGATQRLAASMSDEQHSICLIPGGRSCAAPQAKLPLRWTTAVGLQCIKFQKVAVSGRLCSQYCSQYCCSESLERSGCFVHFLSFHFCGAYSFFASSRAVKNTQPPSAIQVTLGCHPCIGRRSLSLRDCIRCQLPIDSQNMDPRSAGGC